MSFNFNINSHTQLKVFPKKNGYPVTFGTSCIYQNALKEIKKFNHLHNIFVNRLNINIIVFLEKILAFYGIIKCDGFYKLNY